MKKHFKNFTHFKSISEVNIVLHARQQLSTVDIQNVQGNATQTHIHNTNQYTTD